MKEIIDCFFIGHNEMQFADYERTIRGMSVESNAYKDLNLNFVQYKNQLFTITDIYNYLNYGNINADKDKLSLGNVFSLTIAYLATYLNRRGYSFDYVNSFLNDKEYLKEKLMNSNIRIIAIPTTLYVSAIPIIEIMNFIKKYNKTALVVIGGPFIATQIRAHDDVALKSLLRLIGADFYINSSQGEAALVNLISAVKNNLSLDNIDNLIYRENSDYITNKVSIEDNKLEANMPDWSLFSDRIGSYTAIRTSISCPFSCSFCGFPQHAGKYQTASINSIESQLKQLDELESICSVNIIDDTINIPLDRFKEFMRMKIRKNYKFKWNCNFRCQYADEETVYLMKESGCEGAFLGIESANHQILKNMNKQATPEKYIRGLELLKEYDIMSYASFIIGFPGETRETVKDTVQFIEDNKPTFFRTQLWYCDSFTPIWQEREKYGIKNSQFEWSHATMTSQEASEIIDEIFLNIKNSIWVPQYNFEFFSIFNLMHRGMAINKIKDFINSFNKGIKQKLIDTNNKEISNELLEEMKQACLLNRAGYSNESEYKNSIKDKYDANFDFDL